MPRYEFNKRRFVLGASSFAVPGLKATIIIDFKTVFPKVVHQQVLTYC